VTSFLIVGFRLPPGGAVWWSRAKPPSRCGPSICRTTASQASPAGASCRVLILPGRTGWPPRSHGSGVRRHHTGHAAAVVAIPCALGRISTRQLAPAGRCCEAVVRQILGHSGWEALPETPNSAAGRKAKSYDQEMMSLRQEPPPFQPSDVNVPSWFPPEQKSPTPQRSLHSASGPCPNGRYQRSSGRATSCACHPPKRVGRAHRESEVLVPSPNQFVAATLTAQPRTWPRY